VAGEWVSGEPVSDWATSTYGNPCRECGFQWTLSLDDAKAQMALVPASFATVVSSASGNERHPDLAWSVADYVSHVADNLRIWAERLMGVVLGASPVVGGYDESELAQARNYAAIPLAAALWSLRVATAEWLKAVESSNCVGTVLIHPQRGEMDLTAVALANAHDALHHRWDIERILHVAAPGS
jgi:hypothetical protein